MILLEPPNWLNTTSIIIIIIFNNNNDDDDNDNGDNDDDNINNNDNIHVIMAYTAAFPQSGLFICWNPSYECIRYRTGCQHRGDSSTV